MSENNQKSTEELIEEMEYAQHPLYREDTRAEFTNTSSQGNKSVAIVAIIAGTVILLGCIIACAVVAYAITLNPPW